MSVLRLGTRRSQLAMTQSGHVADALRALGHEVELVEIVTEGDTNRAPLTQMGGTGVFAAALREALLRGEVDLAVHSLKDLPAADHPGLLIAAMPPREDPRDALVARDGLTLGELPAGATIGTGSPRRVAALAALGLGFEIRPLRGNVDSRLARVSDGELDAVVLASAGLRRIDRADARPQHDQHADEEDRALATDTEKDVQERDVDRTDRDGHYESRDPGHGVSVPWCDPRPQ